MANIDLMTWWKQAGKIGRQRLREATGVAPPVLNNYVYGRRIPPLEIAEIIARETGIPIEKIPYRFINLASLS